MFTCIIQFHHKYSMDCIKQVCMGFNITATRLDARVNEWCLESDDAANFFMLGLNFNKKVEEFNDK